MPLDDDVAAWLHLTLAAGLRSADLRRLLTTFRDPQGVIAAGRSMLAGHVGAAAADAIVRGPGPAILARVSAWLEAPGNAIVTLADASYPSALLEIPDPPPLLYVTGRTDLLNRPALAIVGSRNATVQGVENAELFARSLSDAGLLIASGLAVGIDAAAHRGGLAGASSSLAVVGTGLDSVYPARNRSLALALAERGALVSELPLGTPARPENFPRRNRLISGLAQGCLVVEASLKSGSLVTARCAIEQGREVFALPGSIHSPLARGCHALIKQGAKLVESANDVLEELRFGARSPATSRSAPLRGTNDREQRLLEALGYDPLDADTLALRAEMSAAEVAALLTGLEIDGYVTALPGRRFQRTR